MHVHNTLPLRRWRPDLTWPAPISPAATHGRSPTAHDIPPCPTHTTQRCACVTVREPQCIIVYHRKASSPTTNACTLNPPCRQEVRS